MKSPDRKKGADVYASLAAQIDVNKEEPLYRQIITVMGRFIEEGRLAPGDRLPPERKLMDVLGVSRSTLRIALSELIENHYISAAQGRGNFVREPMKKRPLRILALERFRADQWSVAPLHYDWITEGGKAAGARIHYHYIPTVDELMEELAHPPSGYDAIVIFRTLPEWSQRLEQTPDALFERSPIPLMLIGRPIRKRNLNVVSWNYAEATRRATRKLIEAGHTRIGFLGGKPVQGHSFAAFYEGYITAMKEAGLPVKKSDTLLVEGPLFVGGLTPEPVNVEVADFLRARRFTAAVPALISAPFERAIRTQAIQVPDELSIMMVSEEHIMAHSIFRWSGFLEPSARIVQRGIALLSDICRGRQEPGIFEWIDPEEHAGATIRAV